MFLGILLSVLFFITNGKNEFKLDRFKENIKFYEMFMITCRTPGKLNFEIAFNSQKFILKVHMLVDCLSNPSAST